MAELEFTTQSARSQTRDRDPLNVCNISKKNQTLNLGICLMKQFWGSQGKKKGLKTPDLTKP